MDGGRAAAVVARLRAEASAVTAAEARRLRLVHALDVAIRQQLAAEPAPLLPELRLDARDTDALVEAEVVAALGIGAVAAGHLVELAQRLHTDLASTLTALEQGRLDLTRVRVLAELTGDLPGPVARLVQDAVLPGAGSAPWEGPSAVTWRRRIRRAMARFRPDPQTSDAAGDAAGNGLAESLAAQTRTWVQVDDRQPLATFSIVAPTEDILWLDQQVTDRALQRPDTDPPGDARPARPVRPGHAGRPGRAGRRRAWPSRPRDGRLVDHGGRLGGQRLGRCVVWSGA